MNAEEPRPVAVMQRHELKFLLTAEQTAFLRERLRGRAEEDRYGRTEIASLYYDTPDFRLIRASLERPPFKEKIRLRSYGPATDESPVFLELKRKSGGIVYKRRVRTTVPQAERLFAGDGAIRAQGQIGREIAAFRDTYGELVPACLIVCSRTAYSGTEGDLRLTIDEDPRYREDRLTLTDPLDGEPLLGPGETILEVKVQDAVPLWLARVLSQGGIRKGSFSKYGEAYRRRILNTSDGKGTASCSTRSILPQ